MSLARYFVSFNFVFFPFFLCNAELDFQTVGKKSLEVILYSNSSRRILYSISSNKLAKARKIRKSPGTLGLKKFGAGKLWIEKFGPKIFS